MKWVLLMIGESPSWCSDLSLRTMGMWRRQQLQHMPIKHVFELSFLPLPPVPFLCSPEPTASMENWSMLLSPPPSSSHQWEKPARWTHPACPPKAMVTGSYSHQAQAGAWVGGTGHHHCPVRQWGQQHPQGQHALWRRGILGGLQGQENWSSLAEFDCIHDQCTESDFPLLCSLLWWQM